MSGNEEIKEKILEWFKEEKLEMVKWVLWQRSTYQINEFKKKTKGLVPTPYTYSLSIYSIAQNCQNQENSWQYSHF